ncbi:TadE/TadG family type IV pilus assembly protein [Devosia sp.]|uniref:TadE/TadG family type IV pilus assembly protein n=1 Tax=Devosia sp. TaxID=1871048 RepID=UPI002FC635D2
MRVAWRRLVQRLRQLRLVEEGTAAVEFALILPIMLLVYIGSVEASALISMDRRVQSVAGTLGDLVARADTTISAAALTDYFRAAEGIMTPYPADGLRQVVTQVAVDDAGNATVVWSRQYVDGEYGVGTERLLGDPYELADAMDTIARGNFVIVAEATNSYLPMYGFVFEQPIRLYRENFFVPRFGGSITVN